MERFAVKRGLEKSIGGNAGLAKLAAQHFENVQANSEGEFEASFGLLSSIKGSYTDQGKLLVDVVQLKGSDLESFLSQDGGREAALASRKSWSAFLDEATGYTAKQRGDKPRPPIIGVETDGNRVQLNFNADGTVNIPKSKVATSEGPPPKKAKTEGEPPKTKPA